MTSYPWAALATLFVCLLMFVTAFNVGRARARYGVKAPATSGHENFERVMRVQMNTLESAALMLPALWIYAGFVGDRGAGVIGAVWIAGRIWYAIAYQSDPAKRSGGFGLSMLMVMILWIGALWRVVTMVLA